MENRWTYVIIAFLIVVFIFFSQEDYWVRKYNAVLDKYLKSQELSLENTISLSRLINQKNDEYKALEQESYNLQQFITSQDWQLFEVTAYSANDIEQGTNNIVCTGFNLDRERVKNLPICATDPEIIPLYSIIEVANYGAFIALDTGGAIKGNRIDILFAQKQEAIDFGRQQLWIRIITK
jgi:cystine transport system substrate-binding protein